MKDIKTELVAGDKLKVLTVVPLDAEKGYKVGDEITFESYLKELYIVDEVGYIWLPYQLELVEEWTPEFGERVLVRHGDGEEWYESIFMSHTKQAIFPYRCVAKDYEASFMIGEPVDTFNWRYIKRIEKPEEMTLEQVCKELGRTIKIVK